MYDANCYRQAVFQGRLWTPDALRSMGLISWYDAAALGTISCDGSGTVSAWNDRLGVYNTSQGAASGRPAFLATGWPPSRMPVFSGDTDDNLPLTPTTIATPSALTAVCIGECSSTAALRSFFGNTAGGGVQLRWNTTHKLELLRNASASLITSTNAVTAGSYHVVGCETGTSFSAVYIDGTITSNTTSPAFTGGINLLMLSSGSEYFRGLLSEIIICNVRLSMADRQRCEGYCAWKWDGGQAGLLVGLLSASHPYKNMPPLIGDAGLRARLPVIKFN